MDITFDCERCGQHIVIDEAAAGLQVQCPKCGENVTVPKIAALPPAVTEPSGPKFVTCPHCGKDVWATDLSCVHCGRVIHEQDRSARPDVGAAWRDWGRDVHGRDRPAFPEVSVPKLMLCPDCGHEVSKRAATCPHCGAPIASTVAPPPAAASTAMTCPSCNVQLVSKEKSRGGLTLAGLFGAFLFVSGAVTVFFNAIVGGVLIVAGIVTSVALRGKDTVMVCPKCKREVSKL
jgi:DNA-directed RNA polymerase subunit RPC12/RpoP